MALRTSDSQNALDSFLCLAQSQHLLPAVAAAVPGLSGGPERYPRGALCPGVQPPEVASQGDGARLYGAPCSADALCAPLEWTPREERSPAWPMVGVQPLTGDIGENAWDSENM